MPTLDHFSVAVYICYLSIAIFKVFSVTDFAVPVYLLLLIVVVLCFTCLYIVYPVRKY